jgi:BirA family transcriptional regulator, biotin operon repressor / biotin---[acetyl-CoA-carboxylase] ligase
MSPAEMLNRLVADEMRAAFGSAVIGREIIVLDQTGSTNDAILQIATPDSKEGLVLFAEHQTAGRGQRGNRWESAAGKGLWFSILLRPRIEINRSPLLTAWAAETISEAIENEFSLKTAIKLPNDVQIDGRKVAGVLVEMRAREKAPHSAIVGIGINVNQALEDFPKELQSRAISLAIALGRSAKGRIRRGEQVDRQNFAIALLRNLDRSYRERFG